MKRIYIFLFVFMIATTSFAQKESYVPLNIKHAYEKGTRSYDGKPGSNYWQNNAKYNIDVNLDPKSKILDGSEDIVYFNNSPDSLSEIIVRLYHNINKPNARRDFYLNEKSLNEGVKINKIIVGGKEIDLNDNSIVKTSSTNLTIILAVKLPPKNSINLTIAWSVGIPEVQSVRFGSYDSTSMFIAYWYPQISVYDDVDGWDKMDYMGMLEMYNDFNDYQVSITVPVGFQIWATGVWQNADEVLNQKYLDRYNLAWKSEDVIKIFEKGDLESNNIYKSKNDLNIFIFNASKVPDFAFGISDHYLWDAVSFVPDKNPEHRIYCAAAYKESSKDFVDVAYYTKESLKYFSYELPGVPFPFPSATVFNGSGGMEYPMIVNNGSADSKAGTVHLTSHELTHQYLPFYMGINERKYPFMDEGWAVMLPFDFQERMADGYKPRERTARSYENFAGNEYDLPLMVPSPTISYSSYRTSAYNRPALAYDILSQTLGDSLFHYALQTYMARWNSKHPIPTDFFFTFNETSGQDLGWFWKPWFYNFSYPDMAIKNVKLKTNSLIVGVYNYGNLPLPVKLQVMYNDKVIKEVYKTADVWKLGEEIIEVNIEGIKNFDAVILGSEVIPDVNKVDNVYFK